MAGGSNNTQILHLSESPRIEPDVNESRFVDGPHSALTVEAPIDREFRGITSRRLETDPELGFFTDRICSRTLWKTILNDYLQHVYPLIPVVHRPTFLQDIAIDRDQWDEEFLGLTVALLVIVVALMPTKFELYQSLSQPIRFESRKAMIYFCYDFLMSMRRSNFFDEISYQKWATSYLVTISFFQIGELNRSRMVEVEAMQLGRLLHFHKVSEYRGLNRIETQLRKKAFWLLFYAYVYVLTPSLCPTQEKLTCRTVILNCKICAKSE